VSLELYIGICAALFGLVMGSGVTALAWRLPRGESWVHGRSRCPGCGHVLGVFDLFPVLSWALSGGRCRHCKTRVSFRYPFTELLCGAWALLVYQRDGLSWSYPLVALWGFMLVTLLFIDLDFQLLPDKLTLPGTVVAIGAALLGPGWWHALTGMLVGAGLLWLVAEVYFRVRRIEGMGGGDVKLAAMFGALLGPGAALLTIFLAAFAGSIWGGILMARKRGDGLTALPFGTLLCPAAMVAYLWGDHWIALYARLLRP
jgi:leader peptidase (prepilin peptidase)/N-methyltransferase